jgi:hypothetical protein
MSNANLTRRGREWIFKVRSESEKLASPLRAYNPWNIVQLKSGPFSLFQENRNQPHLALMKFWVPRSARNRVWQTSDGRPARLWIPISLAQFLRSWTSRVLESIREPIVLPVPAITEVAYLLARDIGNDAAADFVSSLADTELMLEAPVAEDYLRNIPNNVRSEARRAVIQ